MKKLIAAVCFVASLAACSSEPMPPLPVSKVLPPKIMLDVKTISLADRSGFQPANSPYKSNSFTPTISEAIKQWASDRLQAGGQTGQAVVVIKDASLVAQPIPMNEDFIDSVFKRQQAVKYIGRADVSIEASNKAGFAMTNASATRILTLPEKPNDFEKQDAYYAMLTALMKDLGENLESGIQAHMGSFISSGYMAAPTGTSFAAPRDAVRGQDAVTETPLSAPAMTSPAVNGR